MQFISEFFRLLFFTPSKNDFPPPKLDASNFDVQERAFNNLIEKDNKGIVFVFGPWGSGKSTFISNLIEKDTKAFKDKFIHRVSLHVAASINEAFLCMIPSWVKITAVLLAVGVFYGIQTFTFAGDPFIESLKNSSTALFIVAIPIFLFVLINSYRIAYLVMAGLETLLYVCTKAKAVKIIEDFDRSALKPDAIITCLASRVRTSSLYVIPIGFTSTKEEAEYQEIAKKLNANIFTLKTEPSALLELAKNLDELIEFNDSSWMEILNYRDLISIIEMRKNLIIEHEPKMIGFTYYRIFFETLSKKLGLNKSLIYVQNTKVDISGNAYATTVLTRFIQSIDIPKLKSDSGFESAAYNWQDSILNDLLRGTGVFSDVRILEF